MPVVVCLLASLMVLLWASWLYGNGDVQRELQGRVVAVEQQAGTVQIERQFRGQVWRLTLKATSDTQIFTCAEQDATLAALQAGDQVTVYYEPIGRDGVVTLIVVEPKE
jgi:hypothetical protein